MFTIQCSVKCGEGVRKRDVLCALRDGQGVLREVTEAACDAQAKMATEEICVGQECAGIWVMGPWGKVCLLLLKCETLYIV